MLIRILIDNPGTTFTKAIDTKFVDGVRNILRQSSDPSVQQIMRETLNSLETDKASDENLEALLKMWKKEKESGKGMPGPAAAQARAYNNRGVYRPPAVNQGSYGQGRPRHQLPDPVELAGRIEEAKTTAKLLVQLTLSTPANEFQGNDLLKEFSERCQSAHRSLQGFMNSTDQAPDEATFQTLIETCEMLSVATSKHQRALLAARKQTGAVSPGAQSQQQPSASPLAQTPDVTRSPSSPQIANTQGQSYLTPGSAMAQSSTTTASLPASNPFSDEHRTQPPVNATQRYYGQTNQTSFPPARSNAIELDGTARQPNQSELDGENTQTTVVDKDGSAYVPPIGPPPTRRYEQEPSRPSTGGTSDDLYSEHPSYSATQQTPNHGTTQPISPTHDTQPSQQLPYRVSVPLTPQTGSSGINAAAYPPRNTSVDMQTPTRSPPKIQSPKGQWGEQDSPDVPRDGMNGTSAAVSRVKDDEPMTPQMPVSGSGWNY